MSVIPKGNSLCREAVVSNEQGSWGAGMEVERCSGSIVTIPCGRHKVDALYYHLVTHREHVERTPVILRLHGILGNLLDETEHFLPHALAASGYSSLTVNTLLANLGLFYGFGIFDDVMPQIDAVRDFLRNVGFKTIVLAGHGLGGCLAVRYAALRNDRVQHPDIRGVIAIATAYSMPETVRRRWARFGSEPTYEDLCQRAKQLLDPNVRVESDTDETTVVKRAHGPTTQPEHAEIFTLRTWWALAGPEAEGAKTHRHIGKITVPLLLVHGARDDVLETRPGEDLAEIARASGNTDVTEVSLDAGHTFDGRHGDLGDTIVRWLRRRF